MKLEPVAMGKITASGSEQTLVMDEILSKLSGFIDLSAMQVGDQVILKQYTYINGGYKLYANETYNNVQPQPSVCVTPKTSNSKMKITLQQTVGTNREFSYEFNREV